MHWDISKWPEYRGGLISGQICTINHISKWPEYRGDPVPFQSGPNTGVGSFLGGFVPFQSGLNTEVASFLYISKWPV